MTIRNRLQLIGLIPIVLLFLLSSYFLVTSYLNFEKANAFKSTLKNNAHLNDTLVNIGKERGLTALYLGSNKKEFKTSLYKQRQNVDSSAQILEKKLIMQNNTYIPFIVDFFKGNTNISTYQVLLDNIPTLQSIRKKVDAPKENFQTLFFDDYTKKTHIS